MRQSEAYIPKTAFSVSRFRYFVIITLGPLACHLVSRSRKNPISGDYIFRQNMQPSEIDEKDLRFIVRLCHDVLLEVLLFGDRRRLTKLERVGRRFHRIIEDFFQQMPFLRLGLSIYSEYLFYF